MNQYFLLDQYPNPAMFKQIWKYGSPKIHALFDNTSLNEYKNKGPMLLSSGIEKLLNEYKANPEKWSGMIITTHETEEKLIQHLRALLFITYPPESKGILTYYDKHTAHYLFNNTETADLSQWLGPIHSIQWYGGSWQQQANNELSWHEITVPENKTHEPIAEFTPLTTQQQQGLLLARQQKYAYDWSLNNEQSFDLTYQHLQEAIRLNFDELQYLNNYLVLRSRNAEKMTPIQLAGNNTQERLTNLENYWNQYSQDDVYV